MSAPPHARDGVGIPYVRALDGLRGVAVLAVVIFHFAPSVLPGGFLGVDVFFVLSGFLIASLLTKESTARRSVDVGRFWLRRVRRLMPALVLVLLAVAAYAAWVANPGELARLRSHGLATLGYVANWRFIADGTSYTDLIAGASPLRHTWSLAIEEQFYLVFPLVVIGALFFARRDAMRARGILVGIAAVGAVASAVLMAVVFEPGADPSRAYFGTDTRVHSLLVGVLLGVVLMGRLPERGAKHAAIGVLATIGVIAGFAVAVETDTWLYRGGLLGFAVAVAGVIWACRCFAPLRAVLESAPLVGLGLISYGVYLWHWPVVVVLDEARTGLDGVALFAVRAAVTLAIALASYVFVERPIRHGTLGRRVGRPALLAAPVAAAVVVVTLLVTTGLPASPRVAAAAPPPRTTEATAPIRAVVIGDSVAFTVGGGVIGEDSNAPGMWDPSHSPFDPARVELWNGAKPGCSYLPGITKAVSDAGEEVEVDLHRYCPDWQRELQELLGRFRPEFLVVYLYNDTTDREIDGDALEFGSPPHVALLNGFFDALRGMLAQAGGGELVLLTTPPAADRQPGTGDDGGWREVRLAEIMRDYELAHPDAHRFDLADVVCPDGDCSRPAKGFRTDMRFDGIHYTSEGAAWVADWLTPKLEALHAAAPVVTTTTTLRPSST